MKFKISEISRMSGFSPSGIRFFEEAGVIMPTRGKNQKYREFTLTDLQLLLICKQYRECGLSLPQSVEMLKRADIPGIQAHMEHQANCLRQEITKKQLQLNYLDKKIKDIENFDLSGQKCEIAKMPALLFLPLWQPGAADGAYTPSDEVFEWLDLSPIANSCLLLSEEHLMRGKGEMHTTWGLAIEENHAALLNFSPIAKVERINQCECVRLLVQLSEDLTISSDQVMKVREFFKEHNLQPKGPAISRLLITIINNNHLNRYDYLWVPFQ